MNAHPSAPRAPLALSGWCLLLSAAFSSSSAMAQSQSTAALNPVVVSGSREPMPLDHVTADVVLIDAERIRNSTADSVEDLLRREAGLQISRTGGPGQTAGVFIRGAEAGSTLVFVDGVRVGSATLGQVDFSSLNLAQIDHIEVLRGPASSLFGADAVGGLVQIFTRQGEGPLRLVGDVSAGGYSSSDSHVGVSGSTSGFDYAASLSHEESKGVSALRPNDSLGNYNPDRDGYRRTTEQLRGGYALAPGHRIGINLIDSHLDSQYDGSQFLPPDFLQDATPDFRTKLHTQIGSIDYRGEINSTWTTTLMASHDEDDSKSGGTVIDRFVTRRDQLTWQNAITLMKGQQIVAAYEHLREGANSDLYPSDFSRNNNGFVLGYTGQFGAHVLQADLRHDENSVYGGNTTGRLGWSLQLMPSLRVRALYGTTFQAPSFNDLYYPGYGIPTIQAQHGKSVEVGLNWQSGGSEASATVYQNRVRDLIQYVSTCPDASYAFGCAQNVGRAKLKGTTLSGAQHWGGFSLRGTVDFLDAKDSETGQRLSRRAAHQESLSADYDSGAWNAGAALVDVGARPDGTVRLGSYALLDLHAHWRFLPQWQLEAKLLNATNRDYQPVADYQSLGRQAWIGVRYDGRGL